jgi:hypothetical protein
VPDIFAFLARKFLPGNPITADYLKKLFDLVQVLFHVTHSGSKVLILLSVWYQLIFVYLASIVCN